MNESLLEAKTVQLLSCIPGNAEFARFQSVGCGGFFMLCFHLCTPTPDLMLSRGTR